MDNIAFHDLPADAFPFLIEFIRRDTGEVVHVIHVTGPGAINVPPLARDLGVLIGVRMTTPDGEEYRGHE